MKKLFIILCLVCISVSTLSFPEDNGTAVEQIEQEQVKNPGYVYDLSGKKVKYGSIKSGQIYIYKGKRYIKK